jgi:hypothetical protein
MGDGAVATISGGVGGRGRWVPAGELMEQYGPLVGYGLVVLFSLLGIVKLLAPRAFDALVERWRWRGEEWAKSAEHRRTLEEEGWAAERQEEVALWGQMVRLQTQVIAQNEMLLDFVTKKLDGNLESFAGEVREELRDIEKRWLAASDVLNQNRGEMQIMRMELTRLADQYKQFEERVASLVAFGLGEERGER